MMDEQKNVVSAKIDIDTKEANEKIKELTAATNECVEAFEKLEKVMERFEKKSVQTINSNHLIKTPGYVDALLKGTKV